RARSARSSASDTLAARDSSRVRRALLAWYDASVRPLPWRRDRDPYRIWVAEVMLQQTRVDVVMPKFERFVRRFPDVAALARASEESVLAAWSGLGYYTRARSLHRAARALRAQGLATFPRDAAIASGLPGVGRYTLGAVLSIAYDLPYTALDANVVRVLSRLARLPRPDARGEPHDALARALLDDQRPGDWNQALMELGETVCLPRTPRCEACPISDACEAHAHDVTHAYPPAKPRRATERIRVVLTVVQDDAGRLLLERGAFPYLPHLWLPIIALGDDARGVGTRAGTFRHAILHRQLEVEVFVQQLSAAVLAKRASASGSRRDRANASGEQRRLFTRAQQARIGRSSLLTKALALALRASERDHVHG
ncbi:A/G-specific adenine glycosylase, partial [Candidatus Binatia bacterium]|nr:A/G-specific adenine glycosylase [Candidatus Binatia bacterium]